MFMSERMQRVGINRRTPQHHHNASLWPVAAFAVAVECSNRVLFLETAQVQGPLLMTDSEDDSEVPTSGCQPSFDNDVHDS